jgi:acetyl esterase/lipase
MLRTITRYEAYDEPKDWEVANAAQGPLGRLEADGDKAAFPPTFFLHGTGDKVVPLVHSTKSAATLTGLGVEVGEAYEPDQDHGFDEVHCESMGGVSADEQGPRSRAGTRTFLRWSSLSLGISVVTRMRAVCSRM